MAETVSILRRARDVLLGAGFENVVLRPLASDEEGLSVRSGPSTLLGSYMDGTREVRELVNVYVRRYDEGEAIRDSEVAADALVADGLADPGAYTVTGTELYSGPSVAGVTESGLHTYMVGVRADITTRP